MSKLKIIIPLAIVGIAGIILFGVLVPLYVFDPGESIDVQQPGSTTEVQAGEYLSITWTWEGDIASVSISLIKTNFEQEIISSTPCDGYYQWRVPNDLVTDYYQIMISSNLATDYSAYFLIQTSANPPPTTTTPPETTPDEPTSPEPDTSPPTVEKITVNGDKMNRYSTILLEKQLANFKFIISDEKFNYATDTRYASVEIYLYETPDTGGSRVKAKYWLIEGSDLLGSITDYRDGVGVELTIIKTYNTIDWGLKYDVKLVLTDYAGNSATVKDYYFRFGAELGEIDQVSLTEEGEGDILLTCAFSPTDQERVQNLYVQLENNKGERYLDPVNPSAIFEQQLTKVGDEFRCYLNLAGFGEATYRVVFIAEYSHYGDFRELLEQEFITETVFEIRDQQGFTSATNVSVPALPFYLVLSVMALLVAITRVKTTTGGNIKNEK